MLQVLQDPSTPKGQWVSNPDDHLEKPRFFDYFIPDMVGKVQGFSQDVWRYNGQRVMSQL